MKIGRVVDFVKLGRRKTIRIFKSILRQPIRRAQRARYNGESISIISSNCLGGIIYNTLGMEFLSPTINMFIEPKDYLTLVERLQEFVSATEDCFQLISSNPYPIVKLSTGDGTAITLNCVHYQSFEDVKIKWLNRQRRVNFDR